MVIGVETPLEVSVMVALRAVSPVLGVSVMATVYVPFVAKVVVAGTAQSASDVSVAPAA